MILEMNKMRGVIDTNRAKMWFFNKASYLLSTARYTASDY